MVRGPDRASSWGVSGTVEVSGPRLGPTDARSQKALTRVAGAWHPPCRSPASSGRRAKVRRESRRDCEGRTRRGSFLTTLSRVCLLADHLGTRFLLSSTRFEMNRGGRSRVPSRRRRAAAFTLIELLAAMVIIGILAGIAIPKYSELIDRAKVAKAIGDLKAITTDLLSADVLPASLAGIKRQTLLDPWGRPYVYLFFPPTKGKAPPAGARKDRFLVPINSTFDLYSLGKDGISVPPLTAKASRDDVIVANDGGFTGLASDY
jgi:general secretion pathway protein G